MMPVKINTYNIRMNVAQCLGNEGAKVTKGAKKVPGPTHAWRRRGHQLTCSSFATLKSWEPSTTYQFRPQVLGSLHLMSFAQRLQQRHIFLNNTIRELKNKGEEEIEQEK
jgi:hypothetical protein